MMSVYAVMVQSANYRWIDSLWVQKFAFLNGAETRVDDLKRHFEAFGIGHKVWITEMKIEDGAAIPPRSQVSKPEGESGSQQKEGPGDAQQSAGGGE